MNLRHSSQRIFAFLGFAATLALAPAGCFEDSEAPEKTCEGELDACGVCDGPGAPCLGCTVPEASNFDALADTNNGTCSCEAQGSPVADQSQTQSNLAGGGSEEWQSFTPELGGGLAAVSIEMSSPLGTEPSPATLDVVEGEGPGGTVIDTIDITIAPTNTSLLQTFEFPDHVPVTAGAPYSWVLRIPDQNIGYLRFQGDDPYPGGRYGRDATQDAAFRVDVVTCAPDPGGN